MIDEFLTYMSAEKGRSELTLRAYRTDLEQWRDFATAGGEEPFRPMTTTPAQLRAWIASLAKTGITTASLRRKAVALRTFFRYLMSRHGLEGNPALDLNPGRMPRRLPVYVKTAETQAMLNEEIDMTDFTQVRDRLVVDMLYSTGMRCSELMGLSDGAVDTGKCELKVHGKRNKDRIIPFGRELSKMIETYRRLRRDQIGSCNFTDPFFVRTDGRGLYRKLIYDIVHTAMSGRVHTSRMSPHVLRHSFASDMLNSGASLNAVQQLLGHSSLATTQIYTHITFRELQQNYLTAHPRAQKSRRT